MIPSFEFRRRARAAIMPCLQILAVAALVAALPQLISSTVTQLANADPFAWLMPHLNTMTELMNNANLSQEQLNTQLWDTMVAYVTAAEDWLQEKSGLYIALQVMQMLLTPALTLGLYNALLKALRKEEVTVTLAISRLACFLRSIGLSLLMSLRALLWSLPGMALMMVGIFLPSLIGALAMMVGMVLMFVLFIRAYLHYSLAMFFMADKPEMGILACIRSSVQVMRRRKMEMFMLLLSFLGWRLLAELISGMFGAVIGMTLGMVAMLLVQVYMDAAQAAFYEAYAVKGEVGYKPSMPSMPDDNDELN